ncbi:MAG TPA: proline--tRNA ligase [Thermomicrobiales bacterium]|nr:proline--tRNA ligase [Thermomicrobiales bacterium]
MRMTHLFGRTLREAPADAELVSHQLMVRAAMIRPLGAGIYSLLPLGYRVIRKIEAIIREEMDAIGGQELLMPVVHPADVWRRSGRFEAVGPEMVRLKDRGERDMVLAMTHEEVVGDLAANDINSYRQLPQIVYHLQTKFRDEPRARGGLIRVREFTMKDSYSLDADEAGLSDSYDKHAIAYDRIFTRIGLDFIRVGADVGMMGGSKSEEYMAFSPNGEDVLLICPNGDYAANREVATFRRQPVPSEDLLPMEEVETPNTTTIQALADLLDIPLAKTAKAVFYKAGSGRLIFAVIRGDLDVNETKLRNATGEADITPATVDEIHAIGAEPGYGSPVGVHDAFVVADESVRDTPNLVAGANRVGWHLRNVNLGRDYEADLVTDIAAAAEGYPCPVDGAPMRAARAIEIGNIFKLGTRYSEALGATYLDAEGESHPIVMGSYGIGVGRAAATSVEQHHDERGIIWPMSIAPYHVSLLSIGTDEPVIAATDKLEAELTAAGVEVLYDDRPDRPGVKFNDADLIGNPIRLSISKRTLANGQAELRLRTATESELIPLDEVVDRVRAIIDAQMAALKPAS